MKINFCLKRGNNSFLVEQEAESVPLQDVVEKLVNQPDQLDATAIDNLKKGLCFRFFKNSPCVQVPCKFEHVVSKLNKDFKKKSFFIGTIVLIHSIQFLGSNVVS